MRARALALAAAVAGLMLLALFFALRPKARPKLVQGEPRAEQVVVRQAKPKVERPRRPAPEARAVEVVPASAQPVSAHAAALEKTVLQAAVRHDWMVVDEQGTPCPPQKVRVAYDAPADLGQYQKGAYFEPLGPGPGDSDVEVNGLLTCEGSSFMYRGFEAYFRADRGQWDVFPFPVIE